MSHTETASWLVTYDIANPKRLARVFKRLKTAGTPVQYSVFSVQANALQMGKLMAELKQLIDNRDDDVRAYRLPARGWSATLGEAILSEDMWLK